MFSNMKSVYEMHKKLIFFLGFAYGATIVFPAFGPALKVAVGEKMPMMSTLAFFCYTISFLFPPDPGRSKRLRPVLVYRALFLLTPGVLFLDRLPNLAQWGLVVLFSLFAGQLGSAWTQFYRKTVRNEHRGSVAALSIGLTFFILYVCTIIIDYTPVRFSLLIPVLLMLYSGKNLSGLYSDFNNAYDSESMEAVSSDPPQKYYTLYLLFIVIYISGGFTYAGIFPKFEPYTFIAKYYNVQPLFFTVLIAGALADLVGRKTMLYIGFGMVGLSFTAFMMPASYVSYFLTQTCTQIGWGFVNTYVWTVSADMSNHYGKRHIAARGVACMLFGTVLGAVLAHFFNQAQVTHDALYAAATLIPIFVGLIIVNLIPETLRFDLAHTQDYDFSVADNSDSKADQLYSHMEALNALTSREREIAMLLIEDMTRNEICQTLNISINTLKTHIRHIYKKLDVTSKEGLRQKVS